jgi:hypothetical protein
MLLSLIADCGGSFIPTEWSDPIKIRALDDLVKSKRLTVEPTDGGNRYHLTAQGRADAS